MFWLGLVVGAVAGWIAALVYAQQRMKRLHIFEVYQSGVPEDFKARAKREGRRAATV